MTINKGLSAAGAILFVGALNSADAPFWALAALTLALYEVGQWVCRITRRQAKERRISRIIRIQQQDARRWAEEWFNPYREVS